MVLPAVKVAPFPVQITTSEIVISAAVAFGVTATFTVLASAAKFSHTSVPETVIYNVIFCKSTGVV
ncbi:hypothetical protein D3C72_564290 [compost metagenome]